MDKHNHLYKAFESNSLAKKIDKLNSQKINSCPHCGERQFIDYDSIMECKCCNSKFFKFNMEKITDPKLLISIQQIQNIIDEYGLKKS